MAVSSKLHFIWWNLCNFAHFDATKSALDRWPDQSSHYEEKRDRILGVIKSLNKPAYPDLIALCEITRLAAEDLVGKLSNFSLVMASAYPGEDEFQVAILYREGLGLTPELPLLPGDTEDVTPGTRPMVTLHLTLPGHVIRFVACHWTSMAKKTSTAARSRLANCLRRNTYEFLNPEVRTSGTMRHVVILGDLNEEPMAELFSSDLVGWRERRWCRNPHQADVPVKRVRLYNLAWRYLGEQAPHGEGQPITGGAAGTWYDKDGEDGWRTMDHILVSGGLLGEKPPYIDEGRTQVVSMPVFQDKQGLPRPYVPGKSYGVSDHLPLVGQIVLGETPQ
jgi:hypothetical protein